jgi:hypothetical protein
MTEAETVVVAETCGMLQMLAGLLERDHPGLSKMIRDRDTILWEMIDPAVARQK